MNYNYSTNDFRIEGNTLVEYIGNSRYVNVPYGITTIGTKAFYYKDEIIEIILPDTVTEIRKMAFAGCWYLSNLVFPDSITSIGEYAFERCNNLKIISLPSMLKCVSQNAFSECGNLIKVVVPSSAKKIERDAFRSCRNLKEVIMSEGITHIGASAFYNCRKLNTITLPDSMTDIGPLAFSYCEELNEIKLGKKTTNIGESVFRGCKNLTNIIIPQTVKNIGYGVFEEVDNIVLHCYRDSVGLNYAKTNYLKYSIIGEDSLIRQEQHPEDKRICHHQKTRRILKKIPLDVADVKSKIVNNKKVDLIYIEKSETNYHNFCHLPDMRYQYILDIYDEGITNEIRTPLSFNKDYDFYQKASNVLNTLKEGGYLSEQYISSVLTPQMIAYTKSCAMSSYKDISINIIDGIVYLETSVKIGEDELTKVNGWIVDAVAPAITKIEKAAIVMRRILNC